MLMRKGGVILDVSENRAAFYIRVGYVKVETKVPKPAIEVVSEPEPSEPEPVAKIPKKKAVKYV